MTDQQSQHEPAVVVVGPNGMVVAPANDATPPADDEGKEGKAEAKDSLRELTSIVEEPAKVMRIGSMIKQLLEEVKSAPLDVAGRTRMREIHATSIKELESGLSDELVEELHRLNLPFSEDSVPSEPELRIAQAQLVGWLEGLFHGIQTAILAQQMSSRAQMEATLRRALPHGEDSTGPAGATGQYL